MEVFVIFALVVLCVFTLFGPVMFGALTEFVTMMRKLRRLAQMLAQMIGPATGVGTASQTLPVAAPFPA